MVPQRGTADTGHALTHRPHQQTSAIVEGSAALQRIMGPWIGAIAARPSVMNILRNYRS
jgi:hypothetical protein